MGSNHGGKFDGPIYGGGGHFYGTFFGSDIRFFMGTLNVSLSNEAIYVRLSNSLVMGLSDGTV